MSRSLLASAAALVIVGTFGFGEVFAFGIPGGKKLPGLGGGGGGTNAVTSKAKTKAVNKILKDVGKIAFRGGKIVASKQKWACDKLEKAQKIVTAINQPDLQEKVSDLRKTLYCGLTDPIPAELLAPEEIKPDEAEEFAS
ncbi:MULTISPECIES: hypothetical protein [Prochlorococcus]|uniref:Uncharacterized protein n=1 Tax=Prochlorococcus marinus str. MIT 9116 TaxID=167544 RepID=A0A0A1ZSB6_PROMR|nr:hypothetical protein [Prochlorococcus marinus]KGF89816.1 hypothetical protein EU92_1607 [Prochlorococcus marinus str. MIT 9107]KGF92335.1 hypothetical protein EU93_0599 [Prochlorococcus marinus str. MIT 9116]KGF92653.1 hypothetical protein EU94_1651 [Prochlorococcus marinus str. MIT 9123]